MRTTTLLAMLLAVWCAVSTPRIEAQEVIMFVDPNAAWHPDSELELVDFLEANDYSVTLQPIGDVPDILQIEAVEGFDLVYMADSIGSTTVHDGLDIYLKDIEIPLISQEAYMWDEAEWTGRLQFEDFGDTFQAIDDEALGAFTEMDIINPDHPMAAGLNGTVEVYTDPYGFNFGLVDEMGPGANVIATVPGAPQFATLFVYEQGAELAEGTEAAGMRIGMYLGQNVALEEFGGDGTNNRWDRLTPDGMNLVLAAFDYATGRVNVGPPGDFDGSGAVDAADIDAISQAIAVGSNDLTFDLTGDQSVAADDRMQLINEVLNTYVGDSNLDGEFNSGDFVQVFQQGQYEDAAAGNSGWAQGDWNGDAEFNSSDFVAAFQAGGFEQGPRPATAAVPEPSACLLALLGLGLLGIASRRAVVTHA